VFIAVTDCACVCVGCMLQLCCHSLLRRCWPANPVFRQCWPVFTRLLPYVEKSRDCRSNWGRDFSTLSNMMLNKDWQCSWRDAPALSSCTLCCGWYNWRRLLSRSAVLFATLWRHPLTAAVHKWSYNLEEALSLATSGIWIRLLLPTKPYISQSRHYRAQDSLAPGRDNLVVHKNAGRSRSPRAQGSVLLMLGVFAPKNLTYSVLVARGGQPANLAG